MKHDWEDIMSELPIQTQLAIHGARRCRNCGAEQEKWAEYLWMRVVGYRWEPLAGRCKP